MAVLMQIYWYGHSCFKLQGKDVSVVLDPYRPGSVPGWKLPPLTADYCLCSHDHGDHSGKGGVALSGRRPGSSSPYSTMRGREGIAGRILSPS